jgi:hypothetical protein
MLPSKLTNFAALTMRAVCLGTAQDEAWAPEERNARTGHRHRQLCKKNQQRVESIGYRVPASASP